jgi:hypothetical protein
MQVPLYLFALLHSKSIQGRSLAEDDLPPPQEERNNSAACLKNPANPVNILIMDRLHENFMRIYALGIILMVL